jgi:hypothetical protein
MAARRERNPYDVEAAWVVPDDLKLLDEGWDVVEFAARVTEEVPVDWGLILGDILTNLRAALDHAVFFHAEAQNAVITPKVASRLSFPICDAQSKWNSAKRELDEVLPGKVLQVIASSQPANAADPKEHPLKWLNDLVNRDKHRTIQLVSQATVDFDVSTHHQSDIEVRKTLKAGPQELYDGAILGTALVRSRSFQGQPNVRVVSDYVETIAIPDLGRDMPAATLLQHLCVGVELRLRLMPA